jgi:hypothetical protein
MFGAKHGKIHQEELRPFIVNVTLFALSRLPQFRALTESPLGDLMSSVVAGQVFRGIFSAIVQANEDCFYQAQSIVDLVAERLNSVLDSCLREKNR